MWHSDQSLHEGHGPRQPRVHTVASWAVVSAGLAPALLISTWLVGDSLQPTSYNPIRDTMSGLGAAGATDPWVMTYGLAAVSGCYLATAAGLTAVRLPARLLLAVAAACGAGIAAAPETSAGVGAVHLTGTVVGMVTIASWPVFTAWRRADPPFLLSVRGSALATVVFLVMLAWLLAETQGGSYLGLAERLATSVPACWPFVVAVTVHQATRLSDG